MQNFKQINFSSIIEDFDEGSLFDNEFKPKELDFNLFDELPIMENVDKYHSFLRYEEKDNLRHFEEDPISFKCSDKLVESDSSFQLVGEFDLVHNVEECENDKLVGMNNYEKCMKNPCKEENSATLNLTSKFSDKANPTESILINNKEESKNDEEFEDKINFLLQKPPKIDEESTKIKRRFGKSEDRYMFKKLKEACRNSNKDISEFWKSNGKLEPNLQIIFNEIFLDVNFKCHRKFLLKRIRKIGLNTKFSVRETKFLRRLVN